MTADFDANTTFGQLYDPAMEITNQADADAWFERCVAHVMAVRPCDREQAEYVVRFNIGYWTGYYDYETAVRVERLFRAVHPIFGPARFEMDP